MTGAWREHQRGTVLIRRAREYGRTHPDATEEDTLTALGEPVTADNRVYARAGLFQAKDTRANVAGLAQALPGEEGTPKEKTMTDTDPGALTWFTSTYSAAGACVEVARLPNGAGVALRDSKNRSWPPHFFTSDEWAAFVAGVKDGQFDLP